MKNAFLITFGLIGMSLFITNAYALSNFTISGRLKDIYNNSIQANITLSQVGAGNFTNSTETDTDGNYSLTALEGRYDIQYNITSFSKPFWVKFLSVYLSSDMNDLLEYATESGGNISFVISSSENYTIQLYSEEEPKRVLINNSEIENVSSILNLTSNKWFYNESNLYIMLYKKSLPWLHVDGQWIVDEIGRRVQLRGAGGDYTAWSDGDLTAVQTYLTWLKETGGNSIRLAFTVPNNGSWQSPSDTPYNSTYMDQVVNLCAANGIYAILDCHEYYAVNAYQGWTSVLPTYEQAWINNWVNIANRYKNNSVVAIYELANEFTGPNVTATRQIFYDGINAIRATGDNHIVMCFDGVSGASISSGIWTNSSQILPNMCVSNHGGAKFGVVGPQGRDWFPEDSHTSPNQNITAELVASTLVANALNDRAILGCPVFLGEFTCFNLSLDSPNVRFYQLLIEMAEQYGVPWLAWETDQWYQYAPTFWTDFCNQFLGGAFTSPYVPDTVPVIQTFDMATFPALPFNIWQYMDASQSFINYPYEWLGVCLVYKSESVYPLSFHGPCMLRVQTWGSQAYSEPYWGTVSNDTIITLAANQTWDATTQINTVVYAWGEG